MSVDGSRRRDVLVLVPDQAYVKTFDALLQRPKAFAIRPVDFAIEFHADRDPGCLRGSGAFLRRHLPVYEHALVCFDRAGCGRDELEAPELEQMVEQELSRSGWAARAAAVVVDPELEAWVWSDSPHVSACLGWSGRRPSLREWLAREGWWAHDHQKPQDPKGAVHAALRQARKRRSTMVFADLAGRVSLRGCTDRAFLRLRDILRRWFPPN
ncbi:MAG: methylation-associated defense system protein MAD4 [Candidatus Brocadiia bacterium]